MKAKHFQKGVDQLAQEGAVQVYKNEYNEIVLGAVGQLQFEVFEYRLKNEYNSDIRMEALNFSVARWVKTDNLDEVKDLLNSRCSLVFDHYNRPVILFANQYTLDNFTEKNSNLVLLDATEITPELY
jgi:peptide chain release factor 3